MPTELADALEAWRHTPADCIAVAIDALSEAALADFTPPKARSKAAFQAAWLELAEAADPVASGWLARSFAEKIPIGSYSGGLDEMFESKFGALMQRTRAAAGLPRDPRMAAALVEFLRQAPYPMLVPEYAAEAYGAVIDAIVAHGDPRQRAELQALLEAPTAGQEMTRDFLAEALPKAIAALPGEPEAPADAERWLALGSAADGDGPERSEAEVLHEICEHLDEDAPRHIYADLLQQRGETFGEYVALSLIPEDQQSAATRKRSKQLLREHHKDWLGEALSKVLAKPEFQRGLLHAATLKSNPAASPAQWEAAVADPKLGTLRILRRGKGSVQRNSQILLGPAQRLWWAEPGTWKICQAFIDGGLQREVRHLVFTTVPTLAQLRALESRVPFPELEGVTVQPKERDELAGVGALLRQVSGLRYRVEIGAMVEWWRRDDIAAEARALGEVELVFGDKIWKAL